MHPVGKAMNPHVKSVKQRSTPTESNVEKYQPIPDIVSMTQKTVSPNSENLSKTESKSTFRINKASLSETSQEKIIEYRDHEKSVKNLSTNFQRTSQPQKVSHANPRPTDAGNPLHTELIGKFATSSSSDRKVPCLRKVKTKEPRSVKELFPDYRFDEEKNNLHKNKLLLGNNKSNKVSYAEKVKMSNKLVQSPPGPEVEKGSKVKKSGESMNNSKIYDFTPNPKRPVQFSLSSLGEEPQKNSAEFCKAHHLSLRVPKSGASTEDPDKNSFARGAASRKSLSTLECIVQL